VFVQNDWRGLQTGLEAFQRPLRLRDVVTPGSTTSDTIEYARITGVTNNAAPVPEATEVAGTSGTKPMSGMTTAKVTTPVRTIAHWIPVTRRALSDAAQIRTLIDAYLRYGLEEELEDQMIGGDGTGENLEGLVNVSGVQHQPYEGPESDLNLLRTLRKAKTKVRLIGRAEPNAYVLNPEDVERIDLTVDGENRFYFGGPAAAGRVAMLWGSPGSRCPPRSSTP
jgi:HK97 family phage major capsid protein